MRSLNSFRRRTQSARPLFFLLSLILVSSNISAFGFPFSHKLKAAPPPGLTNFEYATDWQQPGNAGDDGGPNANKTNGTFTFTPASAAGGYGTFHAAGAYAHNNGYWFRSIGNTYSATRSYEYKFDIMFPTAGDLAADWSWEAELQQNISKQLLNFGFQDDFQSGKLRIFDYGAAVWVGTMVPMPKSIFTPGTPLTIDVKYTRTNNTITFISIQIGSTTYPLNITRNSVFQDSADYLNGAFQLDTGTGTTPTPFNVQVKNMGVVLSNTLPSTKYLVSVSASPHGAAIKSGSSQQFSATCLYSDGSSDSCSGLPVNWTTGHTVSHADSISSSGIYTTSSNPGVGGVFTSFAFLNVGDVRDRGEIAVQAPTGDAWRLYPTPDFRQFTTQVISTSSYLPLNVVVGSQVAVGEGLVTGNRDGSDGQPTGTPFDHYCNWSSSDTNKATVDRYGIVTAKAVGNVNITCNIVGNATFATTSALRDWVSPGNVRTFTIVNGGTSNVTWYVRPKGGIAYVNSTQTPQGQCDGLSDVDYPGTTSALWQWHHVYSVGDKAIDRFGGNYVTVTSVSGNATSGDSEPNWPGSGTVTDGTVTWTIGAAYPKGQHCAVSNLRDLYQDQATYQQVKWMIAGGDTVIVRQNPAGYDMGQSRPDGTGYWPSCQGDVPNCYMPTIPSGSPNASDLPGATGHHTRILGENFASCRSDSAKTKIFGTYGLYVVLNMRDSQYVDVQCFEVSDREPCANYGAFIHNCGAVGHPANASGSGIYTSALTSSDNIIDVFVHGMATNGLFGASGVALNLDHTHFRASPTAGLNMDDAPWNSSNISTSGGLNMTHSLIDWSGCIEEYPVVHNAPVFECDDQQNGGGNGDAIGTGTTTGTWIFDDVKFMYNVQDGLDLLHSGMQNLTVINSDSEGNMGQMYKVGSATNVKFINNRGMDDCGRLAYPIDNGLNASPMITRDGAPGYCRAQDNMKLNYDRDGQVLFQNNTLSGYQPTFLDLDCNTGEDCSSTDARFQNNIMFGMKSAYNNTDGSQYPGFTYFADGLLMPPLNGAFNAEDHNVLWHLKNQPDLFFGDKFADPGFVGGSVIEISTNDALLDNFNFSVTSASPAKGAGASLPTVGYDALGNTRPATNSTIGALEFSTGGATLSSVTLNTTTVALTVPATANMLCTAHFSDGTTANCTSTANWITNNGSIASVSSNGTISAILAGTARITATVGSSSAYVDVTVTGGSTGGGGNPGGGGTPPTPGNNVPTHIIVTVSCLLGSTSLAAKGAFIMSNGGKSMNCTDPVPYIPPPPPPPAIATGWTKLTTEGKSFPIAAGSTVRYGKNNSWVVNQIQISTNVVASNAYFGKDPLPGANKELDIQITKTTAKLASRGKTHAKKTRRSE